MSNVIDFPGDTRLDIPAEKVLKSAIEASLDYAIVLGWRDDGTLYVASTGGKIADAILIVEQFKHAVFAEEA